MTLNDFLQVCCKDDYVGIWDVSTPAKKRPSGKRFEVCPTKQNYFKIANIPYGRIMHLLHKDVLNINHTDKGFLVRVYNREELYKRLDTYALAREIAKMIG